MLLWQLQWGDKIEFLEGIAKDTGQIPKALLSRPVLTVWQKYFWEAYHVISSSRNFHTAGVASIPLSQIMAYFEIYQINDLDMRNLFVIHIQVLDNAYVEYTSKKK